MPPKLSLDRALDTLHVTLSDERALATEFWRDLKSRLRKADASARLVAVPIMEEALTYRIIAYRLEKEVGAKTLIFPSGADPADTKPVINPALEPLAKIFERLRKVLREFSEITEQKQNETDEGLQTYLETLIKKAEGIYEHALELDESPQTPPKESPDKK